MTAKFEGQKRSDLRTQMGCLVIDGKTYSVYEGINFIGRNRDATVILKDLSVSQQHAIITIVSEDQHFISDIRSYNGTIVGNDKLNPLLLYELSHDSVIQFANYKAIYKKVPNDSQSVTDHCYNGRNVDIGQNTQNFNESFYSANTQALKNSPRKVRANTNEDIQGPASNYFEDDYNFADIPSPPVSHMNKANETAAVPASSKAGLSIHEMPTQIYCADVLNDVSVGQSQTQDSLELEHQIITTKVDVHDLPTQIICHEVAANESVGETHTEDILPDSALHDVPTQIHGRKSASNEKLIPNDVNNASTQRDTVHYKSTQPSNKNTESKDISQTDDLEDTLQNENKSTTNDNTKRKSSTNVSDVIEETFFDDSGLDVTGQSLQGSNGQSSPAQAIVEDKITSSLESAPQSPLHVSQLYRRTCKPIVDDDETVSSGSEIIKNKSTSKNKKPLAESSSEDSDCEVICKQKKKCRVIESEGSGSGTDIGDLPDSVKLKTPKLDESSRSKVAETKNKCEGEETKDKKFTSEKDSSGSDTEIEEFEIHNQSSNIAQNNIKTRTTVITVGKPGTSGIEIKERNKPEQASKAAHVDENNSGSDTEMEDLESDTKHKVSKEEVDENVINSNKLDETDIIPATQASEEDDNDFNFMPESNSTFVTKVNSEHTERHIFDVSQKLKELRNASMVPQNCSEESFHLGVSEVMEGSENTKHPEGDKNEDDDKTPDISDIEDSNDVCPKVNLPCTDKINDFFNGPPEKIAVDEQVDENKLQDIFAMETEQLSEETVQKNKCEIFVKPTTSKSLSNKKKNESQGVCAKNNDDVEEDFFMQPTQLIVIDNVKGIEESAQPNHRGTNDEDIFMQPTQKCTVDQNSQSEIIDVEDIEDDICVQPTQLNPVESTSVKSQPDESIFMQPTQLLEAPANTTESMKQDNNDLFTKPTQKILLDDTSINKPVVLDNSQSFKEPTHKDSVVRENVKPNVDQDDIFVQPTQVYPTEAAVSAKNQPNGSIFMESTQLVEVSDPVSDNEKRDNNDFFMQPTQKILSSDFAVNELPQHDKPDTSMQPPQKHSLSLHKTPTKGNKFDEVESQLEVMFASQTLRMSSQENSRPLNPLVNVLEGKEIRNSQCKSEALETDISNENLKVSESSDSLASSPSLKEYRARPTLPLDELADFPTVHQTEQKSGNNTRKRGRPQKKALASPPRETYITDTPGKGGSSFKSGIRETTLETTDIAETSRKLRRPSRSDVRETTLQATNVTDISQKRGRPRKLSEYDEAVDGKSTESKQTRKKVVAVDNNDLLVQKPSASAYKSSSSIETEDSMMMIESMNEGNKEVSKKEVKGQISFDSGKRSTRGSNFTESNKKRQGRNEVLDEQNVNDVHRQQINEERNTDQKRFVTADQGNMQEQVCNKSNNGKQTVESNRKQMKISRITRPSNVDEKDAEYSTNIGKKENKLHTENTNKKPIKNISKANILILEDNGVSKRQASEAEAENDQQEIIKESARNLLDSLKEPSKASRAKRKIVSEINEDHNTSETKEEDAQNKTSEKVKTRGKKQNETASSSNQVEEAATIGTRSLRKKRANNVSIITVSSGDSDEDSLETATMPTPRTARHRKISENKQSRGKKFEPLQEKVSVSHNLRSSTSNKADENLLSTRSEISKRQPRATKRIQTAIKTTAIEISEEESVSNDPGPSGLDFSMSVLRGKRGKRPLSKDSEKDKAKKMKNSESWESEVFKSNSDTSEINFRTPRNKSRPNVTTSTPDRNRRPQKPKVAFTMMNNPELESLVRSLGGMVVDCSDTCTVLVAGSLKRSKKLLSAVGQGKPICSIKWLQESKKANKFLDPWNFILEDEEAESKWNFSLKESLNRSQNSRLLEKFTVLLATNDAEDVLREAIESCGGKCVMKAPPKNVETNLIVVGNPSKKASYSRFLKQNPPLIVVAPEAIFDGVLRQELHWDDHKLS